MCKGRESADGIYTEDSVVLIPGGEGHEKMDLDLSDQLLVGLLCQFRRRSKPQFTIKSGDEHRSKSLLLSSQESGLSEKQQNPPEPVNSDAFPECRSIIITTTITIRERYL